MRSTKKALSLCCAFNDRRAPHAHTRAHAHTHTRSQTTHTEREGERWIAPGERFFCFFFFFARVRVVFEEEESLSTFSPKVSRLFSPKITIKKNSKEHAFTRDSDALSLSLSLRITERRGREEEEEEEEEDRVSFSIYS
jgi:hypothetical protein